MRSSCWALSSTDSVLISALFSCARLSPISPSSCHANRETWSGRAGAALLLRFVRPGFSFVERTTRPAASSTRRRSCSSATGLRCSASASVSVSSLSLSLPDSLSAIESALVRLVLDTSGSEIVGMVAGMTEKGARSFSAMLQPATGGLPA